MANNAVVVPDTLLDGVASSAVFEVDANDVPGSVFLLKGDDSVLGVKASIDSEDFGDDEHGFGKCHNAHLWTALDGVLVLHEVVMQGDLKSSSSGNDKLVFDSVLDSAETIADGVVDLSKDVGVGALDEKCARARVGKVFDKSVLVLAEGLFVDDAGVAESLGRQVVNRVLANASTAEL